MGSGACSSVFASVLASVQVLIFAEKFIWDPAYVHGNRHGQAQCGWTSHAVHDAQATDGCSGEPFFRFYK